jgi:hypothetical protein
MNDEIVILVCGDRSSNKEVASLPDALRQRAGCTGKITFKRISREALQSAAAAIDAVERVEECHRNCRPQGWR